MELVDYGGVTAFGKGIRQFTEIYDRGYWNAGTRVSDAGYDLFSYGVLCVQMFADRALYRLTAETLPQNRSTQDCSESLRIVPSCALSWAGWLARLMEASAIRRTREKHGIPSCAESERVRAGSSSLGG